MAFLGCDPTDAGLGENTSHPAVSTGVLPVAVSTGPHAKGGWEYEPLRGGAWANYGEARTSVTGDDKWWAYMCVEVTSLDLVGASHVFFYSAYNAGGSPSSPTTGTLRVVGFKSGSSNFVFRVDYYDGSTWQIGTASSTTRNTGTYYLNLEVNIDAKTWDLDVNSSADINGTTGTTTPYCPGTPGIYHDIAIVGKEGSSGFTYRVWEFFWQDNSGGNNDTRLIYGSDPAGTHVFYNYPNADFANAWIGVNTDPYCPQHLYKTVDDVEDDADIADDYIKALPTGTNKDQVFEIANQDAGATIKAVCLVAVRYSSLYRIADKLLAAVPTENATLSDYTPITGGVKMAFKCLDKTPNVAGGGGNAWSLADFQELRVGVRATENGFEYRVGLMPIATIGTGQVRTSPKAQACPVKKPNPAMIVHRPIPPMAYPI
jgi:hypothetical protein